LLLGYLEDLSLVIATDKYNGAGDSFLLALNVFCAPTYTMIIMKIGKRLDAVLDLLEQHHALE
jgi:hypothetical protein